MDTALVLAEQLHVALLGVFVEDVNLVRLASLPFAREVGRLSALERPLAQQDVERLFRLQRARMRALMADVAGPSKLAWSFEAVRGQLFAEVLSRRRGGDLVVMAPADASPRVGRPSIPARRERTQPPRRGCIAAVLTDATRFAATLSAAARLAQGQDFGLCAWIAAAPPDVLRHEALGWIRARGLAARISVISLANGRQLAADLRAVNAAAVVTGCPTNQREAVQVEALRSAAPCPIVLVP
ncbi:MAG: hypothetical protein M0037_14530 [Betaproteobacteria bacterium]|nr:hypothetical protein [Betaproteobacteria bacterium]